MKEDDDSIEESGGENSDGTADSLDSGRGSSRLGGCHGIYNPKDATTDDSLVIE